MMLMVVVMMTLCHCCRSSQLLLLKGRRRAKVLRKEYDKHKNLCPRKNTGEGKHCFGFQLLLVATVWALNAFLMNFGVPSKDRPDAKKRDAGWADVVAKQRA